jgi:hypothetical protein
MEVLCGFNRRLPLALYNCYSNVKRTLICVVDIVEPLCMRKGHANLVEIRLVRGAKERSV